MRRDDIHHILVIGSGPIVIGQACEFDYSGNQAVRALKEEGYEVSLINPNPATVMTTPGLADHIFLEPLKKEYIERIFDQVGPDAILSTMGGQTALNLTMELEKEGILEKYGVKVIGASAEAIERAEDRGKFKDIVTSLGYESARSGIAHSIDDAIEIRKSIPLPLIIRPSFTLGGMGGSIAEKEEDFIPLCEHALAMSPVGEILIEESLIGWREFEMEVMRDRKDNAIIVCSIENVDPMGVHTGDSITIAPIQTLSDNEYQRMRTASIEILRAVGVDCGGSNVQFALSPDHSRMIVIEMNPRVSRSSALASKATGFPIARISAKLAVGYTLDEVENEITGESVSCFEPALDYVAVKVPRFELEKFPLEASALGTQMRSVGETLALGRTALEAMNKALKETDGKYSDAKTHFDGHTEIYAYYTKTKSYCMMLSHKDLRVSHVSTHCSLREACDRVKRKRVEEVITLTDSSLKRMGIEKPHIAVAGLNPHAGEHGLFGTEEIEEIIPAIEASRSKGVDCVGPVPPDSVFSEALGGIYDAVVAMYHDQGHIPLKTVGFVYDRKNKCWKAVEGVNITLGLPIIRTSVDHGTGFALAGKGESSAESLINAINMAISLL